MRGALGVLSFALFVVSASISSGCSGSTEEEAECASEQQAAREFIDDANRACQVDEDCGAVDTGCYSYPGGHCSGYAPMTREAASSPAWEALSQDLDACMQAQGGCLRCLAGAIPVCKEGTCGFFP